MVDNSVIAEKLRKLRGKRHRVDVANACGITVSALTMYETGKRIPRDEIKVALARYYKRSVQYIFFTK